MVFIKYSKRHRNILGKVRVNFENYKIILNGLRAHELNSMRVEIYYTISHEITLPSSK